MKLRFWLFAMDVFSWVQHAAYRCWLWSIERASDATDWGVCPECHEPMAGEVCEDCEWSKV